jgi:O-antigen ligase
MKTFIGRVERAYPWMLLVPVILPVVIWGWPLTILGTMMFPYLVPKTLFFYAITFVTLGAFSLLATSGHPFFWGRVRHKETWTPAALLLLAYVSSVFGTDFYRSFWSIFARGDGLLMLTCAVVSFYLILLYADRTFFERLVRGTAIVGTVIALYGIYEWLLGGGRIGSLLGNAGFFAGYLAISFFATLSAANSLARPWRTCARIGAGLQVLTIILTATRGTMLALALAGLVYLVFRALVAPANPEVMRKVKKNVAARKVTGKERWPAVTLLILVILGGLFFAFRSNLAQFAFTPVARLASIGTNDPDVASRLFIWKNLVKEIEKQPWLGVGAEHIDVLFNRFYDPSQIGEQWFDRSHNAFLDYAAQYGIFGLLLYVALIATFFTSARTFFRSGEHRMAVIVALLALTYAGQNFFIFDTISSFWLILALLASILGGSLGGSREALSFPSWTRAASRVFALVLLFLIFPVAVRPALANLDLAQAYAYQIADVSTFNHYFSRGVALGTYGDVDYGYEAYDMYVNNQMTSLKGDALLSAYHSALTILTTDFNTYSYDARIAIYLAHLLTLSPQGIEVDKNLLTAALDRARDLSPKRVQPWYLLVNLAVSNANTFPEGSKERIEGYAAAKDLLSRYMALVPKLAEPYYALADLDLASGGAAAAAQAAAKGRQYYKSDLETARRAAGYYENVNDWADAQFFLAEVVRLAPTDYASLYDLAKVTYLIGDKAAAEDIVRQLRISDSAILSTDQNFLAAIENYESH